MARSLISWRAVPTVCGREDILRVQATIRELRQMLEEKGRPLSVSALILGESAADQMLSLLRAGLSQSVIGQYSRMVRPMVTTPADIMELVKFLVSRNDVVLAVAPNGELISDLAWGCIRLQPLGHVRLRQTNLVSRVGPGEASTLVWS